MTGKKLWTASGSFFDYGWIDHDSVNRPKLTKESTDVITSKGFITSVTFIGSKSEQTDELNTLLDDKLKRFPGAEESEK